MNEGVAMFNYIGHGSPFKLADESVFLDTDVGTLNAKQDPSTVFVAASCDVGKFNAPGTTSLGEQMIFRIGRGAIGVISATELALSSQNATLNRGVLQGLRPRQHERQYHAPLSEALLVAKSGATNNGQKYQSWATRRRGSTCRACGSSQALGRIRRSGDRGAPGSDHHLSRTGVDRPGGCPVALGGSRGVLIEDSAPIDRCPCFVACCGYRSPPRRCSGAR